MIVAESTVETMHETDSTMSIPTAMQTEEVCVRNKKEFFYKALEHFSTRTSFHGIIFNPSSRNIRWKLLWIFAFLSVIVALLYHTSSTVSDYLEYKTKITQERKRMKYISLPAVTICNNNAIRLSMVETLSNELQTIIENARHKAESLMNGEYTENISDFDKFYFDPGAYLNNYTKEDRTILEESGHQFKDMLLWCTINGENCNITEDDYTVFYSFEYNNCFTIDTSNIPQYANGALEGLQFAFYLEPEEYLPGITETKGVQIVVHSANAFSFPSEDGIALSPGTMTYVALTMENVTRLGKPYSACIETDEYIHKYNFSYSVDLCEFVCNSNQYIQYCGCYPYYLDDNFDISNNVPKCRLPISCTIVNVTDECSCENPCRETNYKYRIDSTQWPSHPNSLLLAEYLCNKANFSTESCEILRNQSESELRDNFVGVNIYYETMFVTNLKDEAEINLTVFLSNLGGCVGLWIGISVFSVFELVYLVTNIIWAIFSKANHRNRSKQDDFSQVILNS